MKYSKNHNFLFRAWLIVSFSPLLSTHTYTYTHTHTRIKPSKGIEAVSRLDMLCPKGGFQESERFLKSKMRRYKWIFKIFQWKLLLKTYIQKSEGTFKTLIFSEDIREVCWEHSNWKERFEKNEKMKNGLLNLLGDPYQGIPEKVTKNEFKMKKWECERMRRETSTMEMASW